MAIKLSDLPNEIIYQILLCVPPASVTKVQQVSRQFNELAQPILWRHYCETRYTYWSSEHHIREKLSGAVAKVDWKSIFSERHKVDRMIDRGIDSILETQKGRVKKAESIVTHGYDAKDALLRHMAVGDDADDVLARRFYSDAVLGALHRKMAVQEWVKIRNGEQIPWEMAFATFDMFVLHERKGDFLETKLALDQIAEQFRRTDPDFNARPPRQKTIVLAEYLRGENLIGIERDDLYHNLQNNFIGIALQDPKHPSLPLVSVVIFCSVAARLGLDAQPCGFPLNVLAIVKPPSGRTLDGIETNTSERPAPMYMDPFRSAEEVDVGDLKTQLQSLGVAPSSFSEYLDVSSRDEMVRRCAKNILNSIQAPPRHYGVGTIVANHSFPEMDGALYAALWSLLLLSDSGHEGTPLQRGRYLRFIMEKMETEYLTDVGLIEEHVLPTVLNPAERETLINTIRVVRTADQKSKQIKRRSLDTERKVQYKVGQVFRHKRYNYQAVVTGWDVECEADDQWITTMNVRSLSRGQYQSFYHVLVEDKSVRYVAEENMEIIDQQIGPKLMALAGQHFKRQNGTAVEFVSNIKDEYPDN
ncbi:hypothetical protein ACLMJK_000201 [Lecanora helva]